MTRTSEIISVWRKRDRVPTGASQAASLPLLARSLHTSSWSDRLVRRKSSVCPEVSRGHRLWDKYARRAACYYLQGHAVDDPLVSPALTPAELITKWPPAPRGVSVGDGTACDTDTEQR